ncbi:DNA-directed RNA polymerase I subunit RPA1-like [Haliotis rubra]|uniref:DNA-directed RNA polymerase I subunit RPA1-like n=1 Tax=Haliotis rubra TaxID=36100 RepID=UPI001EE515DF|nr:DNA-directed RNA polymerase I subunit RPA1-like [Haliotis rubra]
MMEEFSSEIPVSRLSEVSFRLYTSEEIKALSVIEVTNPQTFDIFAHATYGGLHDPSLGPNHRSEVCMTCGLSHVFCPGHMGHIQLPLPVFNPIYFRTLFKFLKGTCFDCHKLMLDNAYCKVFILQMALLNRGQVSGCFKLAAYADHLVIERGKKSYDLSERLDQFVADNFPVSDADEKVDPHLINHKNIQGVRNSLAKEFMDKLTASKRRCPQCGVVLRKLQQKYNTSIGLYGKAMKINKQQKNTENKKTKLIDLDEDKEREADVEELKEGEGEGEDKKLDNSLFTDNKAFTMLTPSLVREHVQEVYSTAGPLLRILFESLGKVTKASHPTDIFFVDVIPVCPSRYRPISMLKGRQYENPQTANMCLILQDREVITQIIQKMKSGKDKTEVEEEDELLPQSIINQRGATLTQKLNNVWISLQNHVNVMVDSSLDKMSKDQIGIKQLLEKKAGLFRKNMMGKRVNYAARSVISPDPCINVGEIGVPLVFAKKLTYPQPVTPWNFQELKEMVINGPDVHPGALLVEMENGWKVNLNKDKTHREAVAKQLLTPSTSGTMMMKPKIVYRHLKNGDYMLLNRQPTLHRPSIQAHRVRVLPGQKTLRLHYANCKAYNADFDGDEMNAHLPQSELARSEAMALAATDNQYLVPKDGTPLAGLIQDHMVSGVSLTVRGRFFDKADYFQLLFSSLTNVPGRVKSLPPAIVKPYPMWSGKQLLSSVLLNVIPPHRKPLNLEGKSKIPEKNWSSSGLNKLDNMGKGTVVFRDGELLQGVLDKAHYGPTSYGMVHCCYELYGGQVAGKLLSCLGKLFRVFLQQRGFTLGVEDILVKPEADKRREKIIKKSPACGREAVIRALNLDEDISDKALNDSMKDAHFELDDRGLQEQDLATKIQTDRVQNDIVRACIPQGLHKAFPDNNLQLMVEAGAKGSTVNCMQISCLLGQIELEGRRPPLMISGRSLPSFLPYDTAPRAGGFVAGRFLTGIKAPEYFFHCMAGREGLVDTAVKTSRSGYLQRCIIKHLEGVQVAYDMTVRDSDNSVVQFCYGEDGLEATKTPFLSPKQFPFLLLNRHAHDEIEVEDNKIKKKIRKLNKKIKSWKREHGGEQKGRSSGFLHFCSEVMEDLVEPSDLKTVNSLGRTMAAVKLEAAWRELDEDTRDLYGQRISRCPSPVMSKYQPLLHPSVMSEKLQEAVNTFCDNQLDQVNQSIPGAGDVTAKSFQKLFNQKVLRAYAHPGEAVGLICAQSIGEPSTQMTLNTFHFAGRGEMNVTLGIPRLKEILQTASVNIKTPAMDIPVINTPEAYRKAKQLKVKLARVTLSEVIQEVKVTEFITAPKESPNLSKRNFRVRFVFLSEKVYRDTCCVKHEDILCYMEKEYLKSLLSVLGAKLKHITSSKTIDSGKDRGSAMATEGDEDDVVRRDDEDDLSDVDPNDGDAATEKEQSRQTDTQEYEEGEDEVEEDEEEDLDGSESDNSEPEDEESDISQTHDSQNKSSVQFANRVPVVDVVNQFITQYTFDKKKGNWCEVVYSFDLYKSKIDVLTVIQANLKKSVVHQVKGIRQTFLVEEKGERGMEWHLKTEGVNIEEMYNYSHILDINRLYTNSVFAFAAVYGVEAASRVLLKEISSVFGGYGINVDYHHLSLLTDYMTFEGVYKGMNRGAINNNIAPFQKMTFETCMKFLVDASINGNLDNLRSPSSRIVAGQVVQCGTGSFDILQSLV